MKTLLKRFVSPALLVFLVAACDQSEDVSTTNESNERITITNEEGELVDRMVDEDIDIPVDTTDAFGKKGKALEFRLRLRKTLKAVKLSGSTLQATSITLNGGYAYISYSMVGSPYLGAIDVVELRDGSNARLLTSATFVDSDVHAVYYSSNYVFLAEASEVLEFDPLTSIVERLSTSGSKKLSLVDNARTPLQSFVATSVAAENDNLYVTTGNTGFLYRLSASSMQVVDSVSLDDARWVDFDSNYLVVMQGTPGRLNVRDKSTFAQVASYPIPGATIAESKSTVQLIGGKALVAAGDEGVQLVNLARGTVVGSIDRVTVRRLDPSVTVTNAASGAGKYVFTSNGEAGVYVSEASASLNDVTGDTPYTFTNLGQLKFSSDQSVNHVAYDGEYLIVASGLGGVRMVKVSF